MAYMVRNLQHRGPDSSGIYEDSAVVLGHTRLSIMDLTDVSAQPFCDYSGRYVLVYNGEIYNYKALKHELSDYDFKSDGDTELVMAAFQAWGISCVHRFNGIFAFAVWDKADQKLWLARDRVGVKPLYYAKGDNFFLFSSEYRGLLASGLLERKLNQESVAGFLMYQSGGYPDTFIENLHEIPPGSYGLFSNHTLEFTKYYALSTAKYTHEHLNSPATVRKQLLNILFEAVNLRMQGVVPSGVFLSGGVDSSAIVALMSLQSSNAINTFTLSLGEKELDESREADSFSKLYQTNHRSVSIHADDCRQQVLNYLNAIDSPSLDGLNTYLISSAASKEGMKVMLSGLGGDELFAGYPGFRYALFLEKYAFIYDNSQYLRRFISFLLAHSKSTVAFGLYKMLHSPSHQVKHLYPSLRQVISKHDLVRFTKLDYDPFELFGRESAILHTSSKGFGVSEYSIAELNYYARHTLLRDNDQMGMANGLEIREPFFDQHLIEFMLGLPDTCKVGTSPKQLLVDTLHPLLPAGINSKKKKGFVLPLSQWMKSSLFDLCDHSIRSVAERDFIKKESLLQSWSSFVKGNSTERWTTMWSFVVLGAWLDKNNID